MNTIHTVLDGILRQAQEKADKTLEDARKQADGILRHGQNQRDTQMRSLLEATEQECLEIKAQAEAADHRRRRLALLEVRGALIDETIAGVKERIADMDDEAYAEFLFRLYEKCASGQSGTVRFSPADFTRIPESFFARCREASGDSALTFVGDLDGKHLGFIIEYGQITENCLVDDLLESMSQTVRDLAYEALSENSTRGAIDER